jgi:protoporphyrinogen oxidase
MNSQKNEKIIKVNTLILGGGISGIFIGREFLQKGLHDFLILEKEGRPGGLCRSFKIGSLYYDAGAHALHKKAIESSERLQKIININELYCQKRNARVFIFERLIPHPLQLHLFYAPLRVKLKCFISYLIRPKVASEDLSNWLQTKFGKQVCKYFLFPYNEKVWKTNLKNISVNWVGRVSFGSLKFLKGLFFGGDQNYNSNEYVCYPNTGGFENLFLGSIKKLHDNLTVNSEAINIDLDNKKVTMQDGKIYQYKNIISTLPVDLLVKKLITRKNDKIINLVDQLEKVSTCLVTFLTIKYPEPLQRIYIPDKKYLAQRIIVNSNSSQYLKKQNESIFSLEISYKNKNDLPSEQIIISNCMGLLKDLGVIKKGDDVKKYKIDFFEYMYPTQTINLENIISEVKRYLENYNCYTIGRFGSWNYANIDGILSEVTELTNQKF